MNRTRFHAIRKQVVLLGLGGVALASAARGEVEYTLTRSSMHSGASRSQGGGFELAGSVGQPGAAAQTGGEFEMTGGFQIRYAPTDCDEGGSVNLLDFAGFQACLTGPDGATAIECQCYDTDGSGGVDLLDFAQAQAAFGGL